MRTKWPKAHREQITAAAANALERAAPALWQSINSRHRQRLLDRYHLELSRSLPTHAELRRAVRGSVLRIAKAEYQLALGSFALWPGTAPSKTSRLLNAPRAPTQQPAVDLVVLHGPGVSLVSRDLGVWREFCAKLAASNRQLGRSSAFSFDGQRIPPNVSCFRSSLVQLAVCCIYT